MSTGRYQLRRANNLSMVRTIRSCPVQPYREGGAVLRVVEVAGRKTGLRRPFPISVTCLRGELYLCSSNRRRDWVQNLLAAEYCQVERDDIPLRRPVLIEGSEAARVLAVYLPQSGVSPDELPFALGDAHTAEIEPHTGTMAVFRLEKG